MVAELSLVCQSVNSIDHKYNKIPSYDQLDALKVPLSDKYVNEAQIRVMHLISYLRGAYVSISCPLEDKGMVLVVMVKRSNYRKKSVPAKSQFCT